MYLYRESASWLHRCHPLVRLAVALAVFVAAFLADRVVWQLPLLALAAVMVASSGAAANVWRLRLLFAAVFVMTFLVWALFYGPDGEPPVVELGPLPISRAGLRFALTMAVKLTVFLVAGTVFLTATRVEEFAHALTAAGVPFRIGFAVTLSFRLVPVFLESAQKVVQAQRCRGYDFERGGILERIRRYVPVLVPVFMGALRRTDGLAMALDARGFQMEGRRSRYLHYPLSVLDVAAAAAAATLVAAYVALWSGGSLAAY
jgi:energy-coupling factor transport system permease protein